MQLSSEVEITPAQAEAIARGLYAVARADGDVHPREAAMVAQFFQEAAPGGAAALAALGREAPIAPEVLGVALAESPQVARLFLKSCVLLALVDDDYTDPERDLIRRFAGALSVGAAELQGIEQAVKEYLLAHLAHLANVEAVLAVSRKMPV